MPSRSINDAYMRIIDNTRMTLQIAPSLMFIIYSCNLLMVQATALVNLKDHSGEWFYSVGPKMFSKSPAGVGFEPLLSALVVECKQGILKGIVSLYR